MPALSLPEERLPDPMAAVATKAAWPKSSLKRKRPMDIDIKDEEGGSSPKRSVTFSDHVEYSSQELTKPPEEIQLEVRRVIEGHALGDDEGYYKLARIFTARDQDDEEAPGQETLRLYTAALASNLSLLGRSCGHLVQSVLDSDWLLQDAQYISLYIRFLGGLVSSHGTWLAPALKMLTIKFSEVTPMDRQRMYSPSQFQAAAHVHEAVRHILQLIPSASQVFSNVIARLFPQHLDSRQRHVRYVRNLLKLREYAPEMHSEVMRLVIERLVKIDVQVQIDFEDLADDIGDDLIQSLAHLEEHIPDELMDDSSDDENDSDDEADGSEKKIKDIQENLGKVDAIMEVLFDAYSTAFENPASASGSAAASLLLSQFTTIVLPTYRSRHTQFLLFHFMQSSAAMVDHFLGTCIHMILDKNRPAVIRQSASTYLASFVARGLHVDKQVARDVFSFISTELKSMRQLYEPECRGPDPNRYHTYYSLVQALLYIFCFRWRDLANDEDDDDASSLSPPSYPGLSATNSEEPHFVFPASVKETLSANIFSPLNPLRVCAPTIGHEFANTSRKLGLLYVNHVLERNKRVRLVHHQARSGYGDSQRETALSARRGDDWMCLDAYFPFDPYRLPISKHWVEEDFRKWSPVDAKEEDSDEDEDEDEDEEEDDEEEDGDEAA